jgi:hypothetical protein
LDAEPAADPLGDVIPRLVDHEDPEFVDQPVRLGGRDEQVGLEEAVHRMLPARESLAGDHTPRTQLDLRLVVGDDLALGQSAREIVDQVHVFHLAPDRRRTSVLPRRASCAYTAGLRKSTP